MKPRFVEHRHGAGVCPACFPDATGAFVEQGRGSCPGPAWRAGIHDPSTSCHHQRALTACCARMPMILIRAASKAPAVPKAHRKPVPRARGSPAAVTTAHRVEEPDRARSSVSGTDGRTSGRAIATPTRSSTEPPSISFAVARNQPGAPFALAHDRDPAARAQPRRGLSRVDVLGGVLEDENRATFVLGHHEVVVKDGKALDGVPNLLKVRGTARARSVRQAPLPGPL